MAAPSTRSAAPGARWRGCIRRRGTIRSTSCTATPSTRGRARLPATRRATPSKTLKDIETVSEARRPLLAYGAIVLEEIIRLGEPKEVAISALGVREGSCSTGSTRRRGARSAARGGDDLNLLRSRSPRHGMELCAWTDASSTPRPAGNRAGDPHPPRRLPARRYRLARASRLSGRAEPEHHRLRRLCRPRPSRRGAFIGLSIFFRHEGIAADKASPRIKTSPARACSSAPAFSAR